MSLTLIIVFRSFITSSYNAPSSSSSSINASSWTYNLENTGFHSLIFNILVQKKKKYHRSGPHTWSVPNPNPTSKSPEYRTHRIHALMSPLIVGPTPQLTSPLLSPRWLLFWDHRIRAVDYLEFWPVLWFTIKILFYFVILSLFPHFSGSFFPRYPTLGFRWHRHVGF